MQQSPIVTHSWSQKHLSCLLSLSIRGPWAKHVLFRPGQQYRASAQVLKAETAPLKYTTHNTNPTKRSPLFPIMSITERETKWKLRLPQDLWDAVPSPLSSAVGLREVCYTLPRAKVLIPPLLPIRVPRRMKGKLSKLPPPTRTNDSHL